MPEKLLVHGHIQSRIPQVALPDYALKRMLVGSITSLLTDAHGLIANISFVIQTQMDRNSLTVYANECIN